MFKEWNIFEKVIFIIGIVTNTVLAFITKDALISVIYTYFCLLDALMMSKGKLVGYYFEIMVNVLYFFISLKQRFYSEMLICCFLIPISIYGLINWHKHKDEDESTVHFKKATKKETMTIIGIVMLLFPLFYIVLKKIGNELVFSSTCSLSLSLLACYSIARANPSSHIFYMIKDIFLFIMWGITLANGDSSALNVIFASAIFFVFDVYSFYNWNRLYKKQNEKRNLRIPLNDIN